MTQASETELIAMLKSEVERLSAPQNESGVSMNFSILDKNGNPTQLTFRANTASEWPYLMRERAAFVEKALAAGWKFPDRPQPAPAPTSGTANQSAPVIAPPSIATPAAPSAQPSVGGVIEVVKIEVLPRADGKSEVKMFAAGHKYADLSVVRTPADLATAFAPAGNFAPDHFKAAGAYTVTFRAHWTPSKNLNSKGNPYQDFVKAEL